MLLLQRAQSLDLSNIKSHILALLPLSLGKNAIVEAELEVKTYSETTAIDYPLYERMRSLDSTNFPLDQVCTSLRYHCIDHCTLANKTPDSPTYDGSNNHNNDPSQFMSISPMVIIYITTVLEHMAEYVLTTIAVTAEQEDTEYIRIKEVYLALLDDVQVGNLFQQTDVRTKLEKRVISYQAQHQPYQRVTLPSPVPSPVASYENQASASQDTFDHHTPELYSDYQPDRDDYDDFNSEPPPSANTQTSFSIKSTKSSSYYRPVSVISNGTTATNRSTSSSKKGFRLFGKKDKRSSVASYSTSAPQHQQDHRPMSPPPPSSVQVYDPDAPALDFEDLIRSGNTMKVSLTPNRLRSIEVKSPTYDRRTSINASVTSPTTNIISSPSPFVNNGKPPARSPSSPSHPLPPTGVPFENPRAAPKPPVAQYQPNMATKMQQTPPLTPDSSIASRLSNSRSPPPSFEDNQRQQQKHSHIKQSAPAPLQFVARRNPRKQDTLETESDDICAMDLPSPPNTADHHPSSTSFSSLPTNTIPSTSAATARPSSPQPTNPRSRYNRPSSMVAKRASGSARPPSYHESFALTMEQQQQAQNGIIGTKMDTWPSSPSQSAPTSSSTGSNGLITGDHPPVTYPIIPSPLRPSTSTTSPSRPSSPVSAGIVDPALTSARAMMRRRTARPLSRVIVEEEKEKEINDVGETSTKQSRVANDDNDVPKNDLSETPLSASSPTHNGVEEEVATQIVSPPPTTTVAAAAAALSLQDNETAFVTASTTSCDRRDRILQLLQQQQKSKPVMVDSSMQTDPLPGIPTLASVLSRMSIRGSATATPTLIVTEDKQRIKEDHHVGDRAMEDTFGDGSTNGSEQGMVDGDEEWFMQDEDWDDVHDQDSLMVEWLLGEN
ncbi:unnamed protein product [Absidia cylindrospora]